MPMYPWRRFRSTSLHASCVSGSDEGVNYTSHHLRCTQVEVLSLQRSRCQQRPSSKDQVARLWPGTAPAFDNDEDDTYSTIFTPVHELQYTEASTKKFATPKKASNASGVPRKSISSSIIRKPPLCRLPASMRFSSLICYITITLFLLTSSTTGAPSWHRLDAHAQLHRRQAIPDSTGNTGNEPIPVQPSVASSPFTFAPDPTVTPASTPNSNTTTPSSSSTSTPLPAPPSPPTPQPTNVVPGSSGNTNSPDSLGLNPGGRPTPFPVASPISILSAGTIAGIASGGVVLLSIFVFVGIWLYRRRHVDVNEIDIRRSKLGSRLAMRVFGGGNNNLGSRSASRADSVGSASTGPYPYDEKRYESSVDKASIGKPKAAWLENGLLSVPKPGFMRDRERVSADDAAPWVDKGIISAPRPGRPRSAEPLGRLSGMGLGMGYMR
ncbi:hypothetical protein BDV96DRAFT_19203 [Lophiotrema nucula]|uniref:Uncharacterized protein n=1 Tax=Lophiotrema nucula TaxID=690887 RepID=A0A6A5ZCA6_9PLEO|nr:hypothetical protein BDV96DRAFT_19203 [Lophiotrema nucula]